MDYRPPPLAKNCPYAYVSEENVHLEHAEEGH